MPALKSFATPLQDTTLYVVSKNASEQSAYVLDRRPLGDGQEVYVHYLDTDKRLDEWVDAGFVRLAEATHLLSTTPLGGRKRKRRGTPTHALTDGEPNGEMAMETGHERQLEDEEDGEEEVESAVVQPILPIPALARPPGFTPLATGDMTEEEYDLEHHKQIFAQRNFERVTFGHWLIKTWYFSPYPLTDLEEDTPVDGSANANTNGHANGNGHGHATPNGAAARSTIRGHGRTLDLYAVGPKREHKQHLWVCDRCFKYMLDGLSWEKHIKRCGLMHPPGRKVYQRGAHAIWEVDGAKDKLYCQNLSLFGKLFIDIKTIYFDVDNFLFYVMTDADSQRDHVLGFFSKEKVSYDDYNLACIVTFPPYQRKRFGMLMIEFSYELSRLAGVVGTPERPLSDLGLRTYLTYWVSTILRYLRGLISVVSPEPGRVLTTKRMPELSVLRSRSNSSVNSALGFRRKRPKGWDGELDRSDSLPTDRDPRSPDDQDEEALYEHRTFQTSANPDGSATTHVFIECTLADLARATHLRLEDAAFALSECGLLAQRTGSPEDGAVESSEPDGEMGEEQEARAQSEFVVVVSRAMVELKIEEWKLKKACMERQYVQIGPADISRSAA